MDLFESFSGDPEDSSANSRGMSGGISRRSIMKAGAAAAWSVPLVQVVAAAPAVAVSGRAALAFGTCSATWVSQNSTQLTTSIQVLNSGAVATAGLQITLTFPAGWSPTVTMPVDSGWSVSGSGTTNVIVLSADAQHQLASKGDATLVPTINVLSQNKNKTFTLTLSATATNSDPASGSISVNKI